MDCKDPTSKGQLYAFHKANIHEDRLAARVCRVFPLALFLTICSVVLVGVFYDTLTLLVLSAIMNVAFWLWIVSTCIFGILGTWLVQRELEKFKGVEPNTQDRVSCDSVVHLIVVPNYKEDEEMLAETLEALSEADDSRLFHIVLAMEAREQGSDIKGASLKARFKDRFANVDVTLHPADQEQLHNDGTSGPEVPGKASNLKWALSQSYTRLQDDGQLKLASVMVTVADADCIFHPGYFSCISKEFNVMRAKPGDAHEWTMWQAPQLSYRSHWEAPICSRTWTYVSSMYEFGGTSGLHYGGHHMVFSGYSLPLQLAHLAESWDGDVIAEDHHCYLKNFFYSVYTAASIGSAMDGSRGCQPQLQVRPVFLPVKSTPVISSEGYWASYRERWYQAKRHTQGVAELSYALLATWDCLCSLPFQSYSCSLFYSLAKILTRLLCMHILPIVQAVGLAVFTLYWLYMDRQIPMCPQSLSFFTAWESDYVLCALAGSCALVWPIVIPIFFVVLANYCFVSSAFIAPKGQSDKLWYKEDADHPPRCGSEKVTAFFLILSDCVLLPFMMVPYGLIAALLGMWNVAVSGNNINYITASKQTKATSNYGATGEDARGANAA